jgi:NTP pyrophosphatase (non-canonical NTP hydrolase)
MTRRSRRARPITLQNWQKMFAEIYPNIVENSAMHLAEEAGEVDEALQNYLATHEDRWFQNAVEELVDVVTNIFGVANCLNLDVAASMTVYFAKGCPKCRHTPCNCGFVTVDKPVSLR